MYFILTNTFIMKQKDLLTIVLFLIMTSAFAQNNRANDHSQIYNSDSYSYTNKLLKRNFIDMMISNLSTGSKVGGQLEPNNKSLDINKQSLDSIIAFYQEDENEKTLYTYDIKGNIIRVIDYIKEENSEWRSKYKIEYTYDEDNNTEMQVSYKNDTLLNQWLQSYKHEYTYNDIGKEVKDLVYKWGSEANEWNLNSKTEKTYNNEGYEILITGFVWEESTNEWENCCKEESSYDEEGNLESEYGFNWDKELNQWTNKSREDYTYNENQEPIVYIYYSWISDVWLESHKKEYKYDEYNQLFQTIQYGWDLEEQWLNDSKITNIFDEVGNTVQEIEYDWNEGDQIWMNDYKYDISYDLAYLMTEVLWPFEDDEVIASVNMPIEIKAYFWNSDISDWDQEVQGNFYYSDFEYDFLDERETVEAQIYPNPVDKQFSIHFSEVYQQSEIQLYDIQGRIVFQKQIQNGESINIEHLDTGVYVYLLNIEGKTQRGKLIKR